MADVKATVDTICAILNIILILLQIASLLGVSASTTSENRKNSQFSPPADSESLHDTKK